MALKLRSAGIAGKAAEEKPRGELLFPPDGLHNHGSCLVEVPDGRLLACWYRGSGECQADDVAIMGAWRLPSGSWTKPFVMADTPGFPDLNPCMVLDPQKRLWLLSPVILNNRWESALMKYRISADYAQTSGPPRWQWQDVLPCKPGPEFPAVVARDLDRQWAPFRQQASPEKRKEINDFLVDVRLKSISADPLAVRLGWMTRAHPFVLDGKRLLVPLYSDRFAFSLMAYTDDGGATWRCSEPIVGPGNIQPSLARRRDGTLVAYFRDGGPPPRRVMVSESTDRGHTWSRVRDTDLPDPGAGLEVLVLASGRWLLVNNDTESGRHSLAVTVSEDEGRTWTRKRHLEHDAPGPRAGWYCYPSVLQARDGTIHVSYSYKPNAGTNAEGRGESIKHVQFPEAWLLAGPSITK
jgi:BNR/Asp-box repeat.